MRIASQPVSLPFCRSHQAVEIQHRSKRSAPSSASGMATAWTPMLTLGRSPSFRTFVKINDPPLLTLARPPNVLLSSLVSPARWRPRKAGPAARATSRQPSTQARLLRRCRRPQRWLSLSPMSRLRTAFGLRREVEGFICIKARGELRGLRVRMPC